MDEVALVVLKLDGHEMDLHLQFVKNVAMELKKVQKLEMMVIKQMEMDEAVLELSKLDGHEADQHLLFVKNVAMELKKVQKDVMMGILYMNNWNKINNE